MKIEFYVYCRKYYEIEIYFENIGAIGINCIERRVVVWAGEESVHVEVEMSQSVRSGVGSGGE